MPQIRAAERSIARCETIQSIPFHLFVSVSQSKAQFFSKMSESSDDSTAELSSLPEDQAEAIKAVRSTIRAFVNGGDKVLSLNQAKAILQGTLADLKLVIKWIVANREKRRFECALVFACVVSALDRIYDSASGRRSARIMFSNADSLPSLADIPDLIARGRLDPDESLYDLFETDIPKEMWKRFPPRNMGDFKYPQFVDIIKLVHDHFDPEFTIVETVTYTFRRFDYHQVLPRDS